MARMLRVYIDTEKWTSKTHFWGKELTQNTEPAWPGSHYVDFELAQFVGVVPLKRGILNDIGMAAGVVAGSITAKRSDVTCPKSAQTMEYPLQIGEDVLVVRDDHDTVTFWSGSLIMVRNGYMAAIGEYYVAPKRVTWAEFEKKGE